MPCESDAFALRRTVSFEGERFYMRKHIRETPVTAKEIGRQLGLSQPTVSRILSGDTGHRVSPETRQRVLETAARMGYRPNALARSLRQGRTNIIGFYTGYGYLDARNPFLAELIGGLQRAADPRRQDILLHGIFRGASTDDIYGELVDGRIDGLFIHTHAADPLAARLRKSSLPVVAIADAVEGVPSVVADDAGGTQLLLDYLWEKGHRCIGYVRPSQRFSSVERRYEAFRAWVAARNLSERETPVFTVEYEETAPALSAIRNAPGKPTAVCCWNDMTAFDLIYHCRQEAVRVPQDLAIVGFDGLLSDPRLSPRALVTVGAAWGQVTERAVELLMRQIGLRSSGSSAPTNGNGNGNGHAVLKGAAAESLEAEIPPVTQFEVSLVRGDTV